MKNDENSIFLSRPSLQGFKLPLSFFLSKTIFRWRNFSRNSRRKSPAYPLSDPSISFLGTQKRQSDTRCSARLASRLVIGRPSLFSVRPARAGQTSLVQLPPAEAERNFPNKGIFANQSKAGQKKGASRHRACANESPIHGCAACATAAAPANGLALAHPSLRFRLRALAALLQLSRLHRRRQVRLRRSRWLPFLPVGPSLPSSRLRRP